VGVTGTDKTPRVRFAWNWSELADNTCDETNSNHVFCDATQFSVTVLKRIQKTREFIEKYAPFNCPATSAGTSSKEQRLSGTDVGITKIQARKEGNDINITATVESSNSQPMTGTVSMEVRDANSGSVVQTCSRQVSVLNKASASCAVGLPEGRYTVKASLQVTLCTGCQNSSTENDSIEMALNLGSGGVQLCEPYSTARLKGFIEATELAGKARWSQQERDEAITATRYNAFLMADAFPLDFKRDFDEFCKAVSFFDCPDSYRQEDGLGEFFASDKFRFEYAGSPGQIDAGKYRIETSIEFENPNWQFFSASQPSARIRVRMTKLDPALPDSVFYYLPFDGRIGLDSNNGRQGYGTNFRQESTASVKINNSSTQLVTAMHSSGSSPVPSGWIKTTLNENFRTLNNTSRGILLDTVFSGSETTMAFSPSFATPLIMKVTRSSARDAFGFYSIDLDGTPQSVGTSTLSWRGIGAACFDFLNEPVTQAFTNRADVHALNAQCANVSNNRETSYGVEWCNASRQGNVSLETVIFTPQKSSGIIKKTAASNDMVLMGIDSEGAQLALNGVPGMEFNSYGSSVIDSVERVFELVKQEKVCVVGHGTRQQAKFFWNPKPVLEKLSAKKTALEKTCIKAG